MRTMQSASGVSIFLQEIQQFVTKISVCGSDGVCLHQEKDFFIHQAHLHTGGGGAWGGMGLYPQDVGFSSNRAPHFGHTRSFYSVGVLHHKFMDLDCVRI